jgi:hypothetical protein
MGRRTWIKIFTDKWLRGTLRDETVEVRGIWVDILTLAGDSAFGDEGYIKLAEDIGYTDKQISGILRLQNIESWLLAKKKLGTTGRIEILENNVIKIINWKKYQSDYYRQKPYRKGYKQKLQGEVTTFHSPSPSPSPSVSIKENKDFIQLWNIYPNKVGKKEAERHFRASVKTSQDLQDINTALQNYLNSERVHKGFVQNGGTWFNNWRDWLDYTETMCPKCKGKGKYISLTGYDVVCDCPKGLK